MIYFHNKCKCNCEYNATKLNYMSKEYTDKLVKQLALVLVEAGILVETDSKVGLIGYDDKKYKVKKVK